MLPKKNKEDHYQYLAHIFQSAGVDTKEKAEEHIQGLVAKSKRFSVIPLTLLLIGYLFAPQLLFFWGLFCLFGLGWIWASTYATLQMMKRYIKELPAPDTSPQT